MIINFSKATVEDACLYLAQKGNGHTAIQLTGGAYHIPFARILRKAASLSNGYVEIVIKQYYGKDYETFNLTAKGQKLVKHLKAKKNKKVRSVYFCTRKILRESEEVMTSLEVSKQVRQTRHNVIIALRQLEAEGIIYKFKDDETGSIMWGSNEEPNI